MPEVTPPAVITLPSLTTLACSCVAPTSGNRSVKAQWVVHRLRFLTFPMRTSRLCSLWPDMRPLRFRRVPFGRDVAFDPGGATASRIAMPHMLPSTVPNVSASAKFFLSWLNPTPHPITVYASHPPSPTTAQHSLPGGALPPYRGRYFTGRNASASPDAPGLKVRIQLSPAESLLRTEQREGKLYAIKSTSTEHLSRGPPPIRRPP